MRKEIKVTEMFSFEKKAEIKIPCFEVKISAGFPSPAEDYAENKLDLNEFLIKHPSATFFIKVSGDSMVGAGINSGDILIVDRAEKPGNNRVVIAVIDGEFTVKRIHKKKEKIYLVPENAEYKPIEVKPEMNFEVWGVVTYVIHPLA
ncbi:translesion error-prone DNA polymerase V autoproteolytic subunit [candidate division WOR-3 bacterium]|nr:translesion error-prone DNA polymerase V autoproteolytic subunit [candidate division WOR-3 bacterium]